VGSLAPAADNEGRRWWARLSGRRSGAPHRNRPGSATEVRPRVLNALPDALDMFGATSILHVGFELMTLIPADPHPSYERLDPPLDHCCLPPRMTRMP